MKDYPEINNLLSDLLTDPTVQQMKTFTQHGAISTYDHCINVVTISYILARVLSPKADFKALLTGALLHDFYLYDWHNDDNKSHRLHGFFHPRKARDNAIKHFDIDRKTADIIDCHMWPLTFTKVPRSKEGWIVCLADKIASSQETLFGRKKNR